MKYADVKNLTQETLDKLARTAGLTYVENEKEQKEYESLGYVLVFPSRVCIRGCERKVLEELTKCEKAYTEFIFKMREGIHEDLVEMFLEESKYLDDPRDDDEWLCRCGLSYKELYLFRHISDAWVDAHRRIDGGGGKEEKAEPAVKTGTAGQ